MDETEKVSKTGVYTLIDDTPVRLKEGDMLPLGAKYRDAGSEQEQSPRQVERQAIAEAEQQRAKGAAPENRAKAETTEKR